MFSFHDVCVCPRTAAQLSQSVGLLSPPPLIITSTALLPAFHNSVNGIFVHLIALEKKPWTPFFLSCSYPVHQHANLWLLSLKHTPHLGMFLITSTTSELICPTLSFLESLQKPSVFYFLTCILPSILQTTAGVTMLKYTPKPSYGSLAHSK